jgi:molybdopterin molybdotransferase
LPVLSCGSRESVFESLPCSVSNPSRTNLCIDNRPEATNIKSMLELEEARRRILAAVQPLPPESVALNAATDRILAEDVASPIDLPPFDNSAMDGYAVQATDVSSASAGSPVELRIIGRVPAGETFPGSVKSGTCVRIFTGSPLPAGADAVAMQEDSKLDPSKDSAVLILDRIKPWENIRFRGEDVKRGTTLASAGERLTPTQIGLFGAVGLSELKVSRQPTVGLLATGTELTEPGAPLNPGKIYESNRLALAPLLARSGASARILPLVPDTLADTKSALASGFAECDAVLTTGGVSVGELDFVRQAFEELGGKLDFWKVAIKPGKPFVFGQMGSKFLFGLPGNPVSAFVTFLLLVRPALLHWQRAIHVNPPSTPGILIEPLSNDADRRHFVRVHADQQGRVKLSGAQASHLLASLASANGLLDVPPNTTLPEGTHVRVIRLDG